MTRKNEIVHRPYAVISYLPSLCYTDSMLQREDLQENGLCIYSDKPAFSYGSDAIALAAFTRLRAGDRALDLGAGTGILAILLQGRYGARFTAVELRGDMCALIRKSVEENAQGDYIETLCADLRELRSRAGFENFDAAVCNPPYFSGGTPSENEQRQEARHQQSCTLADAAECASRLLKEGGRFFVCYPASGLSELCSELSRCRLEPKRIKIIGKRLVLAEAKKGAKPGLTLEYD